MRRKNILHLAILALSLFIFSCGGSGSSATSASGTSVQITASITTGTAVSAVSTYDGTTFSDATGSFTLTSSIFSGALHASDVTLNSIDVTYTPLVYDAVNNLVSPSFGTGVVFHRGVSGIVPAGGTLNLSNLIIFGSLVGVQSNTAVTSLLDGVTALHYRANITFNMTENDTNTPMTCTITMDLFLI